MKIRSRSFILTIAILALTQLLFQGSIGIFSGRVNLTLVALIILLNFAEFSWVVGFVVVIGILSDIYSGLSFGILTGSLFFSALVLKILFDNFFTNFSYYSLLLLSLIAVVLYNIIFILLIGLLYFIGASDYLPKIDYLNKIIWQIVTTELIMTIVYYFINTVSSKFKPVFLG